MSETRKIVVNRCFGGFGLSRAAFLRLREWGSEHAKAEPDVGEKWPDGGKARPAHLDSFGGEIPRDDPLLVRVVEEMGPAASASLAKLVVVEIPADVKWAIGYDDGLEHVEEEHRTW